MPNRKRNRLVESMVHKVAFNPYERDVSLPFPLDIFYMVAQLVDSQTLKALTRVCRTVGAEASRILYLSSTIDLCSFPSSSAQHHKRESNKHKHQKPFCLAFIRHLTIEWTWPSLCDLDSIASHAQSALDAFIDILKGTERLKMLRVYPSPETEAFHLSLAERLSQASRSLCPELSVFVHHLLLDGQDALEEFLRAHPGISTLRVRALVPRNHFLGSGTTTNTSLPIPSMPSLRHLFVGSNASSSYARSNPIEQVTWELPFYFTSVPKPKPKSNKPREAPSPSEPRLPFLNEQIRRSRIVLDNLAQSTRPIQRLNIILPCMGFFDSLWGRTFAALKDVRVLTLWVASAWDHAQSLDARVLLGGVTDGEYMARVWAQALRGCNHGTLEEIVYCWWSRVVKKQAVLMVHENVEGIAQVFERALPGVKKMTFVVRWDGYARGARQVRTRVDNTREWNVKTVEGIVFKDLPNPAQVFE